MTPRLQRIKKGIRSRQVLADVPTEKIIKALGMAECTYYRKLNGAAQWTIEEANIICRLLKVNDLAERAAIFLAD